MPELPEVETVKNVIKPIIVGHKVVEIDVLRAKTILGDVSLFKKEIEGKTCTNITRIGKFIIFHFDNQRVIISHLRMEGKFYELNKNEPYTKYARVVYKLDNGHRLCFDDMRCFGIMKLSIESNYKKEKELAKLGPEPFDVKDINAIYKANKNKKGPIKSALLDQSIIAGLGNIYVDEVLYLSNIHPHTPTNLVSLKEWQKIIDNSVKVLNEAIKSGGSTIRSYHPGKGIDGSFQLQLHAYGKEGEKCPLCGSIMRKTKTGGRGTTFCPKCQIKKGGPILVAITGKAGSGKSTVLNEFKEKGFDTLSSDLIVMDLYSKAEVIDLINKRFNTKFTDRVDKNVLRELVLNDSKKKKELERIIHPLVKKEIISWVKKSKSDIKVVEVPLLYESKMENLFDYIIATNSNKSAELLKSRDGTIAKKIAEINKSNQYEQYKNKVDFVINNNSTLNDLKIETDEIISRLISYLN